MKTTISIILLSVLLINNSCANSSSETGTLSNSTTELKLTQALVLTTFKKEFNDKIWKEFLYDGTKPENYYWEDDCLMIKEGVFSESESPTMNGIVFCKTPELFSNAQSFLGDIDADGLVDALVVYTIEGFNGGNNSVTFYTVLLSKNDKLNYKCTIPEPKDIGYDEIVEIKEIKDGVIIGKKFQVDALGKNEIGAIKWVYENDSLNKL
jgi:hypothetical protein